MVLVALTLIVAGLIVLALAGYLTAIAVELARARRNVARLADGLEGVAARGVPLGEKVDSIAGALHRLNDAFEGVDGVAVIFDAKVAQQVDAEGCHGRLLVPRVERPFRAWIGCAKTDRGQGFSWMSGKQVQSPLCLWVAVDVTVRTSCPIGGTQGHEDCGSRAMGLRLLYLKFS